VMIECEVRIHRELEAVAPLGQEIFAAMRRRAGLPRSEELPGGHRGDGREAGRQARRLEFRRAATPTWDHRKLGGTY